MKKTILSIGVLSVMIFTGCKKDLTGRFELQSDIAGQQANNSGLENAGGAFVRNEILVKFKKGTPESGRANAFARISGKVKEHILTGAMKYYGDNEGLYLLNTPLRALDAISKISGVEIEYAEPNYIYTHGDPAPSSTITEVSYSDGTMWGMYGDETIPANQFGSQAGEAWAKDHTGSANVYVGIIDEGIRFTHPDLDGQVWTNPNDPVDGNDNDGNGYADDIHGWDFSSGDNSIYDGGSTGSSDNHGTHVAGTIGARANNDIPNNNQGVVGVNWNVTLISGKFLGASGGTTANAVKAVDYFTDLKLRHKLDIVATNNSWGGGGFTQSLLDAITRGAKQNILFIAAAGNGNQAGVGQNNDKKANYPSNYNTLGQTGGGLSNLNDGTKCNYDAVIAVAAIKKDGTLAGFSNYGAKTVDLGAPGVGIWSTIADGGWAGYSGTSMGTPHVTGGAALSAAYSSVRGDALKKRILDAATPTSSLSVKL
jgi:subtilisin family serine protease